MTMSEGAPKHPYHLVDPSPWPALGALGAFIMMFGFALGMHPEMLGPEVESVLKAINWWILLPGLAIVLLTMYLWWGDVIVESRTFHSAVVQIGLRYGMILFIASEVLFFAAFFWAFFDSALYPNAMDMPARTEADGGVWPPKGVTVIAPFDLPFMNTLILLLSGTTVTWAHHAILENNKRDAVRGLLLTVILGLCFTGIQAYEYFHAPFGFRDNIYSSTFFMATGFHGFHVMVGTTFLLVCLFRAMKGQFKPNQHFGFEAAAWYWHFVDVVWLFLFFCIYWWGSGNAPIAHH
ncbi:cytochrome c oxidase subunit 3 [Reyranella sp.]|uniref:cytochrome c oxidase subunit 3 n=1 Tax=Reyranella sp. TaxID=1929291 RepID=UPI0039C8D33F